MLGSEKREARDERLETRTKRQETRPAWPVGIRFNDQKPKRLFLVTSMAREVY